MFLFFVKLHSMSLVYVFFIFRFYDLLHSSLSYLYYCILSYYRCSSCTFHILLSCTILILHIHLYVLILSILYFVLLYTFHTFSLVYILIFISCYNVLLILVTVCTFIAKQGYASHIISYYVLFISIPFVYTFPFSFIFMSANTLKVDSGNN